MDKKPTRGGYREGAGRPKTDRKPRMLRLNDAEHKKVKAYADKVRAETDQKRLLQD